MRRSSWEHVCARISALFLVAGLTLAAFYLMTAPAHALGSVSVDLFTQKAPFDGKGLNQSSDLFGPQEQVTLYFQVLENNHPLNEILVTYEIDGPLNRPSELKFYQTAQTNSSGMARTTFSLATINETDSFGTWVVSARIEVDGAIYGDSLSFKVDWLVELISVRTLDGNLSEKNFFSNGGFIGFEITLRNNAMTKRAAILRITVFDELHIAANTSRIDNDLIIPPNKKNQYIFGNLYIPKFAVPGNATITVAATDENIISLCPQISKGFFITTVNPIFPEFVDAFVYTECAPTKAQPGQEVTITVWVRNEGTMVLKNIQVQTCVDSSPLDARTVAFLDSYQSQKFSITWNTQGLAQKSYNITSQIQTFPNESDLTDNSYSCDVKMETAEPELIHDIQIKNVTCSKSEVAAGEIVEIFVAVKNVGNATESSDIRVYYDEILIQQIPSLLLESGREVTLTFHWNTTGVPEGTYRITAEAETVPGEANIDDNTYTDGKVKIEGPTHVVVDVAVTALSASPSVSEAYAPIQIAATVENLGNTAQTFTVEFHYDELSITSVNVYFLVPGGKQNLTVTWNTFFVMEGNYTVKAYIPPLTDEENTTNNLYVDGTVSIKKPQFPQLLPLLSATFAIILLAGVFLLLLLFYSRRRRRRRKRKIRSYYTVVARPHI